MKIKLIGVGLIPAIAVTFCMIAMSGVEAQSYGGPSSNDGGDGGDYTSPPAQPRH